MSQLTSSGHVLLPGKPRAHTVTSSEGNEYMICLLSLATWVHEAVLLLKWLETAQWRKSYQNSQTSFSFPRETYKRLLQIKTTALPELFTCGFVSCVFYNAVLLVGVGVSCVSPLIGGG